MKRARRAFTLVELLVVIAVIAVLAGLIFPVFSRVREGAHTSTCSSNLRQLGLAFAQYIQDNQRYPLAGNYQDWAKGAAWVTGGPVDTAGVEGTPTDYTDSGFSDSSFNYVASRAAFPDKGSIYPYVKSTSVYVCPTAPDHDKKKLSYSMSCALAGIGSVRIRQPEQIVLLVDEGQTINDGYFWASNNTASTDSLMTAHNGGGNLLFADGHVKFYPANEVMIDSSTAGLANKTSLTNPVRFLDPAFGPKGAMVGPKPPQTIDTCGTNVTTPTPGP